MTHLANEANLALMFVTSCKSEPPYKPRAANRALTFVEVIVSRIV